MAIGGVAQQSERLRAVDVGHESGGHTVVMVFSGRLHVGMIGILTKIEVVTQGFILPARATVVLPKFSGGGFKENTIQGEAERAHPDGAGRCQRDGVQWDAIDRGLRGDLMGIAWIGEAPVSVIGQGIDVEFAIVGGDGDFDLIDQSRHLVASAMGAFVGEKGSGTTDGSQGCSMKTEGEMEMHNCRVLAATTSSRTWSGGRKFLFQSFDRFLQLVDNIGFGGGTIMRLSGVGS